MYTITTQVKYNINCYYSILNFEKGLLTVICSGLILASINADTYTCTCIPSRHKLNTILTVTTVF